MPMSDFLQLVIRVFLQAIAPALGVMIIGMALWGRYYSWAHPGEEAPAKRFIPMALFLAYLGGLAAVTLFLRSTGDPGIQSHLFRSFWEAWNYFNVHFWFLFLGNIAMFMPLGFFLPLLFRPFRRWYVTIPTGFGISLLIEAVQLVFQLGSADVDDLFCNTLGNALGYCLCMVGLSVWEKKPARGAVYGVFPLLAAMSLAGIFLAYETQPYGNLMEGPSIVADTSGVEWVLDCDLSDEPGEVGICHAEPFDYDSCIAFADAFIQARGGVMGRIENYDEFIYFEGENPSNGHTHILMDVYLADRSYEYRGTLDGDGTYEAEDYANMSNWDNGQMTEEYLREALKEFGIQIPEQATMTYDGPDWKGYYTFEMDQIKDGEDMVDGTVRCQVMENGEIFKVKYAMTRLVWQADEPIISEAEAYERLRQGRFSDGQYFEATDLSEVHVWSCTLDYISDTKGYRQPVYYFELAEAGSVFVPALRDYRGP